MDWLCQAIGDHTCKIKKLVSKTGEPFLVTSKTSMFCTHAPLPAKLKKKNYRETLIRRMACDTKQYAFKFRSP